jgi:hypothetical protein
MPPGSAITGHERPPAARCVRSRPLRRIGLALLLCLAMVRGAHADMSGAWSGTLALAPDRVPGAIALALSQSGHSVTGTLAVQLADPALDGSYQVRGRVKGRRLRLSGVSATGVRVVLHGVGQGARLTGRGRLRVPGRRRQGRLALTRQAASGDGSACDAVFSQNETTFMQLTGQVLEPVCAACHTASGQAASTRLRVTPGDALATARSVATVVDPVDPASSLVVTKPTGTLPHGGGLQVTPGSAAAELLLQWATLLRDAGCVVRAVTARTPAAAPAVRRSAAASSAASAGCSRPARSRCRHSRRWFGERAVCRAGCAVSAGPVAATEPLRSRQLEEAR